jgi:cytochrome c oxidase subunit 2
MGLAENIDSAFVPRTASKNRLVVIASVTIFAVLIGCFLVTGVAFADGITTRSESGSPNAESISWIYKLLLGMAAIIFIGVEGLLIWFLIKYRARKRAVAAQIHGNTRLEIGWTVGAALLLVIITAVTFIKLPSILNPPESQIDMSSIASASSNEAQEATLAVPKKPKGPTLHINVQGMQYLWRYQYPGQQKVFSFEEMVVPVGATVELDVTSNDVAHSWWVPALGGKADAIPGYVNHTWFQIRKPGVYYGQCAEFCGRGHATMIAKVRAVSLLEYRAWLKKQAAAIQFAQNSAAKLRKKYSLSQLTK